MANDAMTSDERVWATIRLERPDRTPVIPTLLPEPAAGLAGVSQAEIANDNSAAVAATFDVFDEYGGWDNIYPSSYLPSQLQVTGVFPMRMKIPGRNLADDIPYQLDEVEVMKIEDYDKIADQGFERFFLDEYLGRLTDLTPDDIEGERRSMFDGGALFLAECAKRDIKPFFLANCLHPFFKLSLMRSMVPFTQDLFYEPETVLRALRRMTDDLIPRVVEMAEGVGIPISMLTEERASGFFYSPKIFERFWWPYTVEIVEACWSEDIVSLFHLDTSFDKNMKYFRQLPRGAAILELDGTTDIFAAKEVLRGHLCLKGDVPAALLATGTPEEVESYCRRLISEVGGDGGFILGTGCSVPPNARPENFRAMIETGKQLR
ncbi:MAG: uroporphyrinogen decarboxylase family protein [Myxococcota bacterium]|nr:uroporphyrinogen decarboxylase family protein [Myxococcota bacterium]